MKKAFTIVELLVVISIISILLSIGIYSVTAARKRSRDTERKSDLQSIQVALESYKSNKKQYPNTQTNPMSDGGVENIYTDPGCVDVTNTTLQNPWIPELAQGGFISNIPKDPNPKNQAKPGNNRKLNCYMYQSDGKKYLLSAWGTVESQTINDNNDFFSWAGFREEWNSKQYYFCAHKNISNNFAEDYGNYYKHSFTKTNLSCTRSQ